MSPDLATLQADFSRAILGDDRSSALSMIAGDPEIAERRLSVYLNTALSGLCEALRLSYPLCEKVVGIAFFDQTALAFARLHPPVEPVLARYGAGFSGFLASVPGLAGLPYLPDLAGLEWAVDQASHVSPDPAGRRFDLAMASGIATVTLTASLRLVSTATAVDRLWRALRDDDDRALGEVDWSIGGQWLAIHHGVDGIVVTSLSEPAWRLCAALLAGDDIDVAVAKIEANGPVDATALAVELLSAPFVRVALNDPEGSPRP